MAEPSFHFVLAQQTFTRYVHAIGEGQWTLPTPDTAWDVRDLVTHLIDEHRWAAPILRGLPLSEAAAAVAARYPAVTTDLVASWDEAAAAARAAFGSPEGWAEEVELTRGRAPTLEYVEEMTFDLLVHAWDLGRSIGSPDELPEVLVVSLYEQAPAVIDRTPAGMFRAPVEIPADAPLLDRLIALTGRDPR